MIEDSINGRNFVEEYKLTSGGAQNEHGRGEERSVLAEINDLFDGHVRAVSVVMVVLISCRLVFTRLGDWKVLKHLDLTSEQIMAFGDSENDIEMLELAGIAYAMENADGNVKAVATALAPANSQAGVIRVLENWLERG